MKKPSNNKNCTVCPHKNKKDEEYEDGDELITSESQVKIKKTVKKRILKNKKKPLKRSNVHAMNRNVHIRLEQKRNASQQVIQKRNNLHRAFAAIRRYQSGPLSPSTSKTNVNKIPSNIALRCNNHYYGIDHFTDVPKPQIGDTFCNIVTGDRYLYNKDIWNHVPNPGPRAYYGENMTREELVTNPQEGDIFFQKDEISIFQNGNWITKSIITDMSHSSSSQSDDNPIGDQTIQITDESNYDDISYGTSCVSDEDTSYDKDDEDEEDDETDISEELQEEELQELNMNENSTTQDCDEESNTDEYEESDMDEKLEDEKIKEKIKEKIEVEVEKIEEKLEEEKIEEKLEDEKIEEKIEGKIEEKSVELMVPSIESNEKKEMISKEIETNNDVKKMIETLNSISIQRIIPKLNVDDMDKIYNFMIDGNSFEGRYCNLSQKNYDKIRPIMNDNGISMKITPQGVLNINIKFKEERIEPIKVNIESWIKYNDNEKNIWQTVTCISDIKVINKCEKTEKYTIETENEGETLKQMQSTYTTMGSKEKIIIKPIEKITEISWSNKLLAYPLKSGLTDFYLVEFNDNNNPISLPNIAIELK